MQQNTRISSALACSIERAWCTQLPMVLAKPAQGFLKKLNPKFPLTNPPAQGPHVLVPGARVLLGAVLGEHPLQRNLLSAKFRTVRTWKMLGEACASQYFFSSGWALTTMHPRTPGTANSSMSLPLSPHTMTPSAGRPAPFSICGMRVEAQHNACQHARVAAPMPSDRKLSLLRVVARRSTVRMVWGF